MRSLATAVLVLPALVASAAAFDDSREGFIIEVDLGASWEPEQDDALPLVGWLAGAGITDRWLLTLGRETGVQGLLGVGVTVFSKQESPSWLAEATIGSSSRDTPSGDSESGFGAQIGVGREFARHWLVRFTVGRGWFEVADDWTMVGITVGRLWY